MEAFKVLDMRDGQSCYVVPWAVMRTKDGWTIPGVFNANTYSGGTATLLVTRKGNAILVHEDEPKAGNSLNEYMFAVNPDAVTFSFPAVFVGK